MLLCFGHEFQTNTFRRARVCGGSRRLQGKTWLFLIRINICRRNTRKYRGLKRLLFQSFQHGKLLLSQQHAVADVGCVWSRRFWVRGLSIVIVLKNGLQLVWQRTSERSKIGRKMNKNHFIPETVFDLDDSTVFCGLEGAAEGASCGKGSDSTSKISPSNTGVEDWGVDAVELILSSSSFRRLAALTWYISIRIGANDTLRTRTKASDRLVFSIFLLLWKSTQRTFEVKEDCNCQLFIQDGHVWRKKRVVNWLNNTRS